MTCHFNVRKLYATCVMLRIKTWWFWYWFWCYRM